MTSPAAEVPSASSQWTGASEVDLDTHVRNQELLAGSGCEFFCHALGKEA